MNDNEIVQNLMQAIDWEFGAYTTVEKKTYAMMTDFREGVQTLRNNFFKEVSTE